MFQTAPPTWTTPPLRPGDHVRITQRIESRDRSWSSTVEGIVETCQAEVTGSWYAHGKNDKLWLLRLRLRKADGELTTLVIDHNSKVEKLSRS